MRQIEFRGLRTDGKGWIYGYYFEQSLPYGSYSTIYSPGNRAEEIDSETVLVIRETVGQISFSQDVFGNAIYQGHIVIDPLTKMISVVKYGFCKKLDFNGWFLENEHMNYVSALTEQDLEIIGNIHESPELIKQ